MKRDDLYNELKAYEKNFRYIESNLLYPNLNRAQRRRIIEIYNSIFRKKESISLQCSKCIKPYIKKLGEWYFKYENKMKV